MEVYEKGEGQWLAEGSEEKGEIIADRKGHGEERNGGRVDLREGSLIKMGRVGGKVS